MRIVKCRCENNMTKVYVDGHALYVCSPMWANSSIVRYRVQGCHLAWRPMTEWCPVRRKKIVRMPNGEIRNPGEWKYDV